MRSSSVLRVCISSWWCLNEYPSTGAVTLEECAQRNDTGHFWHFAGDGTVRVDNSNWGWANPMLVDRCLVVNATRPVNGAPVMTTSCRTLTHYPLNQHFAVYSDLTILPLPSKCLTVPGGRADNGTVIQLSDCNSSPTRTAALECGRRRHYPKQRGLPGSARRDPSQRRCGGPGQLQQQFGPQPALDDTVTKRTRRKSIAGCSACHESFIFVLLQVRSSDMAAHFAFSCDVRSQPGTAAHPPKSRHAGPQAQCPFPALSGPIGICACMHVSVSTPGFQGGGGGCWDTPAPAPSSQPQSSCYQAIFFLPVAPVCHSIYGGLSPAISQQQRAWDCRPTGQ